MTTLEDTIRRFGEQTNAKTNDIASRLGITLDREFADKAFALNWAMATMIAEDAGDVVEFDAFKAARAESLSTEQKYIAFCFNTCRGGFALLASGDNDGALKAFGLVCSIQGYLLRNDYKKIFAVSGSVGGKKRHEAMNRVKAEIIHLYAKGGSWKSARQASKKLAEKAKELATKEGTRFATDDIAGRLYDWILKSKKTTSSP